MKIEYIKNILNNEKTGVNSNKEEQSFLKELNNFIKKYSNYKNHMDKKIISELVKMLKKQENIVKEKYNKLNRSPYFLSKTYSIINSLNLKIKEEESDKRIDFNVNENHKTFSRYAFEAILSQKVNILAYRGDNRKPLEIFQKGFYSLIEHGSKDDFMCDAFMSKHAAVALTSDFKAASYFPITEDISTYIYICKVRTAYNTVAEHYKRFVLNNKNIPQEYLNSLSILELNTDKVEPNDVYAVLKIKRSKIDKLGDVPYYSSILPAGREFVIKSIEFNNKYRSSIDENQEFIFVKNQLQTSLSFLINKNFCFLLDKNFNTHLQLN